jgi:hypothetical protein
MHQTPNQIPNMKNVIQVENLRYPYPSHSLNLITQTENKSLANMLSLGINRVRELLLFPLNVCAPVLYESLSDLERMRAKKRKETRNVRVCSSVSFDGVIRNRPLDCDRKR